MLHNILELLELMKTEEEVGDNTLIALGKYKAPESLKEAYKQHKRELWRLRKT